MRIHRTHSTSVAEPPRPSVLKQPLERRECGTLSKSSLTRTFGQWRRGLRPQLLRRKFDYKQDYVAIEREVFEETSGNHIDDLVFEFLYYYHLVRVFCSN